MSEVCPECGGEGIIITCSDDMCVGSGECVHWNGEETCPTCGGTGEVLEPEDDDED